MSALTWTALGALGVAAILAVFGATVLPLERAARGGVVVAWLAVGAVVVADLVDLARGDRPGDLLTHLGYAVAAVAIIPLLAWRAPVPGQDPEGARAPASLWVVAIAALVTVVVVLRLAQTS